MKNLTLILVAFLMAGSFSFADDLKNVENFSFEEDSTPQKGKKSFKENADTKHITKKRKTSKEQLKAMAVLQTKASWKRIKNLKKGHQLFKAFSFLCRQKPDVLNESGVDVMWLRTKAKLVLKKYAAKNTRVAYHGFRFFQNNGNKEDFIFLKKLNYSNPEMNSIEKKAATAYRRALRACASADFSLE